MAKTKPKRDEEDYLEFLLKKVTDERGQASQQRFLQICRTASTWAPWLSAVVQSSQHEDRRHGVDAWVKTTDVGRIPIQIKSSHGSRINFEEETRRRGLDPIHQPFVIVVKPEISDERIKSELITGAEYIRNLRLKRQRELIA